MYGLTYGPPSGSDSKMRLRESCFWQLKLLRDEIRQQFVTED